MVSTISSPFSFVTEVVVVTLPVSSVASVTVESTLPVPSVTTVTTLPSAVVVVVCVESTSPFSLTVVVTSTPLVFPSTVVVDALAVVFPSPSVPASVFVRTSSFTDALEVSTSSTAPSSDFVTVVWVVTSLPTLSEKMVSVFVSPFSSVVVSVFSRSPPSSNVTVLSSSLSPDSTIAS